MRPPHACRWLMTKGWFFWPLAPGAQPAPGPDGDPSQEGGPHRSASRREDAGARAEPALSGGGERSGPPPAEVDPDAKTTGFWCNRTQQPFGPDGDRACEADCRRGRTCFEPEVEA